ncbi:ankyrin-3-like [Actinia tenebrosa]|uniref:Ankyrin-3-like n=1 Tax=Actinia tenebrosa TaxID=6105 RepID=A0A6P8HTI8_ACTTE|nr:ankyrin-3-like [Actinia tenebrosa]
MLKFAVKKSAKNIFHDAVSNKDLSRLKFILQNNQKGFNIDELDEDGLTALQRSCFIGNLKLVQLLVNYGANIDIQDREGWSVLHASAVAGNSSILRYLVCMGADVTTRNDFGELAIDLASDLDCVIILAEAMISAGHRELIDGYFAKQPSLKALIEDRLREISKKPNELSEQEYSSEGSKNRSGERFKKNYSKTLESRKESTSVNTSESRRQPLGNISNTSTNKEEGLHIIERGGQPEEGRTGRDKYNTRIKRVECKKCHGKKRLSTSSSCSVSSDSSSSSSSDSAYVSSLSLVTEGLPTQIEEPTKNETYSHDDDVINPVFDSVLPKQNSTPENTKHRVHNCRKHEKRNKSRSNSSPASVSTSKRHRILSKIKEHSNVNALNESGLSLLHVMARQGDAESVKILLENGAEVNRQALNGSTPLHEAAQSGSLDCILMLLSYEADLFAENDNGFLPIDKAKNKDVKLSLHKAMAMK